MNSEEYGWKPEVSQWYNRALDNKKNPNAEIWEIVQRPENSFQAASWWLAEYLMKDLERFGVGHKNQIKHLVSKEETRGSFPFTQYVRELCQNALDSAIDKEHLNITLNVDEDGMLFSHDGRSFKGPKPSSPEGEMASLYAPGMTTKKGTFNSEGRFGIGFKGWMIFFERIDHEHSDGNQKIKIGYQFDRDGYDRSNYILKGTEHPENLNPGERNTSFRFSKPTEEFQPPSIDEIINEWTPMIRFANHGVSIKIKIMEQEAEVIHRVNVLGNMQNATLHQQEIFESFTKIDYGTVENSGLYICTYDDTCDPDPFGDAQCPNCNSSSHVELYFIPNNQNPRFRCSFHEDCVDFELSEMPKCPECEDHTDVVFNNLNPITKERIIGIRSQIKEAIEIDNAIIDYIDRERAIYTSEINEKLNPWADVKLADWYANKYVTLAVNMSESTDASPWLFSMAEITSADDWPNKKLHDSSNWIIDGPFILSPTRKELKNDELSNAANASILKFVLSGCLPNLANHLLGDGYLGKLNQSTPFDILFSKGVRNPIVNEFHGITFAQDENVGTPWGRNPKSYLQLFGGFTLYCNYSGDLINARQIRRIPDSWKVDTQQSLAEWLQEKDEAMEEFFDFIPFSNEEIPEIINEGNHPLSWIIPEIDKGELYRILSESGLSEELAKDYPQVVHSEWYQIPIDNHISCLIFGPEPNDNLLVNKIKKYAVDPTLEFIDGSNEQAIKYKDKTHNWIEEEGRFFLTVPPEPTDEWWFDRFMERIIRDNIKIPKDEIEKMAEGININEDVSYFVAKAVVRHKNQTGDSFTESEEDLVIIPKKFNWSNWTILPNTMTAWKTKKQNTGSGIKLWKNVNLDNHSKILCNSQIYVPTGDLEYFCTYTGAECRGVFEPKTPPNEGEMPSCPDCKDYSDVIQRGAAPLSCIANKEFFIVIGSPINSDQVIDLTLSIAEKRCPDNHALQSAIMIARPYPLTDNLRERLKSETWTKLPTLSITNNEGTLPDGFRYNDKGIFNQDDENLKRGWAGVSNNPSSELEPFYSHFIGHTLNLHGKYREDRKKKNALIREIGQKELISHSEWAGIVDIPKSTKIISQINQERNVNHQKLSCSLIRINRDGPSKKYSFKKANVRTNRMQTAAFNDLNNIPNEETQILVDKGWCGFSETPELEPEAWMISLMDGKDTSLGLFDETKDLEFIHISEISVSKIPDDKTLLKGLCLGSMKVIESIIENETDSIKLIIALSNTVEVLDRILPNENSLFELLNDYNIAPSVEQKDIILNLIERAIEISDEDDLDNLNHLKSSLDDVQAQTWDDVIQAIGEYETDEEKWNYFQSISQLPKNPPVFTFKPDTDTFRRGPEIMKRKIADYSYISNTDAKNLFNISEKSGLEDGREEDAIGWTIPSGPRNNKRLYIMDEKILHLLDYQDSIEYSIGKVDLQDILHLTTRGKKLENIDDKKLEGLISRQWGFAQLLIALKSSQISNDKDFETFIPEIGERNKDHACEVFKGRQINLGKGGWDLCPNNSENENNLMLVTNNKEQGQKAFLLQLILKLDIPFMIVVKTSIQNDEDIRSLAQHFGIEFDKLKKNIATIRKTAGGHLLNPWLPGEESEDWDLRFGKKPEWRTDKDKSIKKADARKLLKEYTNAISSLLRRGNRGPARNDETQDLIHNLPNVRNEIKDELYQNIGSLLADEPIVSPPGEVSTKMGNLRRYRKINDNRIVMLENAKLDLFIGNLLFLSRFSTHRGTMYSDPYGLKERTDQTIEYTLNQLLKHKDAWGSEETILLRDVMQIGPSNYLSLRLHKYHAICIVALDQAFASFEENEE